MKGKWNPMCSDNLNDRRQIGRFGINKWEMRNEKWKMKNEKWKIEEIEEIFGIKGKT